MLLKYSNNPYYYSLAIILTRGPEVNIYPQMQPDIQEPG
jgi:hypothetical protein